MHPDVSSNQEAWDLASQHHVDDYQALLEQARGYTLFDTELSVLRPLLESGPEVVHLQSGHGLDDIALIRGGARTVIGVDYSKVAVGAAQRRADELGAACTYIVSEVPGTPLADQSPDLVYTGNGALAWMRDLDAWAQETARLLRPEGHLFIHEAHPAEPLWTLDEDEARIRPDRSYFAPSHVNDSFPANGAIQWQWTLGQIVNALIAAGLEIRHLGEHAQPFWRWGDIDAASWRGRLPNTFTLLARRPSGQLGHP